MLRDDFKTSSQLRLNRVNKVCYSSSSHLLMGFVHTFRLFTNVKTLVFDKKPPSVYTLFPFSLVYVVVVLFECVLNQLKPVKWKLNLDIK